MKILAHIIAAVTVASSTLFLSGTLHAADATQLDSSKYLATDKISAAGGIKRIAITSCNVLFAVETSANAQTQRGFGDTSQRLESKVSVLYLLKGMDQARLQAITENMCADAAQVLASKGFEVVPDNLVRDNPEFAKLHATGQATPYDYERAGSKYMTFAPSGQRVIDSVYLKQVDSMFSGFKAMSTDGPQFVEARLAKSLSASAVHVNLMVDFASAQGNTPSGFLGRLTGSDTAKVESKVSMSLTGFVTAVPEHKIDCSSGFCQGANDARLLAKITSKAPVMGGSSMVTEVVDAKTTADKIDGVAANVISGLAALAGHGGAMISVTKNGVVVDPQAYEDESRKLARQFLDMSASVLVQR